jgi:hypothetical protein
MEVILTKLSDFLFTGKLTLLYKAIGLMPSGKYAANIVADDKVPVTNAVIKKASLIDLSR